MGCFSSHLESKEDRLNRIEASSYQSPDGIFDLAIRNQAHEKSLFDTEDTEKRLEALRDIFAGLSVVSTTWCLAAATGYVLKRKNIQLPSVMLMASVFLIGLSYIGMYFSYMSYPSNVRLLVAFTLSVACYNVYAVNTRTVHPVPDACFILCVENVLMLVWTILSFHSCCSRCGWFDIKAPGFAVYLFIMILATVIGLGEVMFIKHHHSVISGLLHSTWVFGIAFWMYASFLGMLYALTRFKSGHTATVIVYTFVWPVDLIYICCQGARRNWEQGL